MKAIDLMVGLTGHLDPDLTLAAAVRALSSAPGAQGHVGADALPVINAGGSLIGILSVGGLLDALLPSYMLLSHAGDFSWDGMAEEIAVKARERKVSDAMATDVVSIRDNAPLMAGLERMIGSGVHQLPVMDDSGHVVGMLYERDIFIALANLMLGPGPKAAS